MPYKFKKDAFDSRTAMVTVFFLVFFALIAYRLFKIQVVNGAANRKMAESQHSIIRKILPSRGEIRITDKFSSDTYPVATNIKHYLVYAVPSEIQNPLLVSQSLASVLTLDAKDLLVKISNTDKKYVPLKKQLTDDEQSKIKDLKLAGVYFDSEDARYYPEQRLLSQVLGFVGYGQDNQKAGLYGLEKFFQPFLAGTNGSVDEEKDTAGAWIFGARRDIIPATDGTSYLLTIDKSIQYKAESVLKKAVTDNVADSGTVIVMNPKTGAVLAMASYPDFNPNEYGKVTNPKDFNNEAVMDSYEPGSTFKGITMAAAIDEGKVTPETTYNDTGSLVIDGYTIKNSDGLKRGSQTMSQVLEESLNTGVIFAKDQIGNADFFKYIKKFGFGVKTGIELPEAKGNLDGLKYNVQVNYATASFGQGISVTPLQLVQAYTALANNGKMMKPYIVQSKISPEGQVTNTEPQIVSQVISTKTANVVSAMLVGVVENGHGKKAAVPGYYIAGKTGTAQVPRKDGKGYEANNNIGSFVGYGPVEDPQFVMLVRIDHPRDVKFAEVTAAPAWGELASFILHYYNIAPTRATK